MYTRGHRGVGAIFMLLVLVLSATALLPILAKAQTNQIVGLVSDCDNPTTFLGGAQVTLTDANGVQNPVTTTTANDGTFAFDRSAGSYTLSVTRIGYYSTGPTAAFRFDGSVTVRQDLCMDKQNPTGLPGRVVTVTVENAASQPISGAIVSAFSPAAGFQFVTSATTNSTGKANLTLWEDTFQLRTTAAWYAPDNDTLPSTGTTFTVVMDQLFRVVGHAIGPRGFVSAGLVAYLYDPTESTVSPWRLIQANVNGSLYDFHAPAGTYTMIVDVNGFTTFETTITLPGAQNPLVQDATLSFAPPELYQTTVLYGPTDWNNLTVYRNLTLNRDSTLSGLGPTNLRDLRLQIDATLGNGDGTLDSGEATTFQNWLVSKGPLYVTTDSFLLTNGKAYNSSASSFAVSVGNLLGTGGVWINTSATYVLKTTSWIKYGEPKYFVNVTALGDTNLTQYHNELYVIQLPRAYEMVSNTLFPPVTVANYTRITIDPGIPTGTQTPQVKMIIEKSLNGTARAKVTGPAGKFFVANSTFTNYQAFVANDTSIQFSAADSTDPVGDITKANFTWRFRANVSMTESIGYGIQPTFTYATPGEYKVNLTVVQAGGNVTYRDITVWVDGTPPTGNFRTNATGTRTATDMAAANFTLMMNQGTIVRFNGSASSDIAYPGKPVTIPNSGYAWDFNGDRITDATGRIVNNTFTIPGDFTVNLTVTDAVGWKGVNVSLKIQVNDTQAPTPNFDILDPTNDYVVVPRSNLVEMRNYTFNASKTTDNHNGDSQLNFTWTIPGPIFQKPGTNNSFWGINITIGWREWNNSYSVKLVVRDTGFGSNKPNNGTLTVNLTVQVDTTIRPDLQIPANSLKIDNANPEESQRITVSVNVTDKTGRAIANAVQGKVYLVTGTQSTLLSTTPTWSTSSHSIAPGATVTLTFQVTVVGTGNKTVKVCAQDTQEPYTWVTSENCASQSIVVRQAAWVNIAIFGSVVGVFAVFIFAMYYRRKVKAGEWQPRLRRGRKEKGEGEEKRARKEKEVKEEKKRL